MSDKHPHSLINTGLQSGATAGARRETVLTVSLTPDQARLVDDIQFHHAAFHRSFKDQMQHAFICGVKLHQLKATVKHGDFIPLREAHFPALTHSAAGRYMQFVDLLKGQISTVGNLLDQPLPKALPEPQLKQLTDAVHEAADGKTWTAFYRDLHLCKQRGKGGFHPPTEDLRAWLKQHHPEALKQLAHDLTFSKLAHSFPDLAAAYKKQFKPKPPSADLLLQARRDRSRKLREQLAAHIDERHYAHDTHDDARLWKAALYDAYKAYSAMLKGHKKKGQGK